MNQKQKTEIILSQTLMMSFQSFMEKAKEMDLIADDIESVGSYVAEMEQKKHKQTTKI